jgi:hypothetical protein
VCNYWAVLKNISPFSQSFDGKFMHISTFVLPSYLPHVDEVIYVYTVIQVVVGIYFWCMMLQNNPHVTLRLVRTPSSCPKTALPTKIV